MTASGPANEEERSRLRARRRAGILAIVCVLLLAAVSVAYVMADRHGRTATRIALEQGTAPGGNHDNDPAAQDFLLGGQGRLALWLVVLGFLTLTWLFTGRAFSESWAAIFISRDNRFSLSQVQFILWTLLFASSILALLLIRMRSLTNADALDFRLPTEAALLMGLSSVSFGGAQIIQANKRSKTPTAKDVDRAVRQRIKKELPDVYERIKPDPTAKLGSFEQHLDALEARTKGNLAKLPPTPDPKARPAAVGIQQIQSDVGLARGRVEKVKRNLSGVLAREDSPKEAKLLNLVQGDELTNRDNMDLGKTQLAFFSLFAILAYFILLWRLFYDGSFYDDVAEPYLGQLPPVSEGLVALLGASHAGYLGAKAAGTPNQA